MLVINLPDEIIDDQLREVFSKMEPIPNRNLDNGSTSRKSSPIICKISREVRMGKSLFLIVCALYKTIFQELRNRKIIVYNQENDSWQGVDYDGD